MDIQTRKLELIKAFLKIQSEELISRLEKVLENSDEDFNPMTNDELNLRIEKSLEDSKNEKVTESSELLSEIHLWQ